MPPRRRDHKNRDLPDNLYFTTRKDTGVRYYEYHHPVERTPAGRPVRYGMGTDKTQAIEAAKQLNLVFARESRLVDRVAKPASNNINLGRFAQRFEQEILPARRIKGHPLSPHYVSELVRVVARIVEHFGPDRAMAEIRQDEIAAYLNGIDSKDASNKHRAALCQLWKYAVSDGVVGDNIPARIIPRDADQKVRQRLTLDAYKAIFKKARPSVQRAMELSLNAIQRRSDIQKWRFDDQRDGFAYVIQQKTRKHGPSAYLRIPLSLPVVHSGLGATTLGEIIDACRDDVLCPFLVHEKPVRLRKSKEKVHHFQLSRKQISDGFAEARDATGLFADIDPEQRPTFHEVISLGEHLREQSGWTVDQIRQLRGHTTDRQTKHYLEGHTWTTVDVPMV